MPSGSSGHAASEADRFREELSQAETRGPRHYDERREHQSWPQQVEDDQETLRGTNDDVPGPVPDNPPGLWGRQSGQDVSIGVEDQVPDFRGWITRISEKKNMRGSLSNHGQNLKILMFGERISHHYTSDPKCRGWNTDLCLDVQ
jgi:hypothetical protein